MNITLEPHVLDQEQIKVYGRRVGYCGAKPGMPISFLTEAKGQCGLTDDEKREVIAHVIAVKGSVRKTPQTERYWPPEQTNEDVDS